MRIGWVIGAGAVIGFSTVAGARAAWMVLETPAETAFAADQAPPLVLPDAEACTQEFDASEAEEAGFRPPPWTAEAVEAQVVGSTAPYPDIEVVDIDCDENPCIAWLLWQKGTNDPALAYRWWSFEGEPTTAMWTASRTYDVDAGSDSTLQAVSVAPSGVTRVESAAWQQRVASREQARLLALRAQIGRK